MSSLESESQAEPSRSGIAETRSTRWARRLESWHDAESLAFDMVSFPLLSVFSDVALAMASDLCDGPLYQRLKAQLFSACALPDSRACPR